eukprot:scaffold102963_cov71-Phaeocystis_antarctica.AAC.7
MSSPGDYLHVRVGPAFGIAPCGELWAKELGGGAWRQNICACLGMSTKWSPTPLHCSKNSLRGLGEKAFSLQRGRGEKICVAKMKFRSSARPDLRITLLLTIPV